MNKSELIDKLENYLLSHGFDYHYSLDGVITEYCSYSKYNSYTLRSVTGILNEFAHNDSKDELVNMDLVNAIAKCLWNSSDIDLMNIAWNTFISCSYDNRYILYNEVTEARNKYFAEFDTRNSNHTQILETQRLIIKPNDSVSSRKLSKYIYTYDKPNDDFSSFVDSYSYLNNIIFILTLKETKIDIGFVGLQYSRQEGCYYLNYYIMKKYRKHGYAKEGIKVVLEAIKENKVIIYG